MNTQGLSAICGSLGCAEEDDSGNRIGYFKSEFCLDSLKDLVRFLRRDDPVTRDVFKEVCKLNTVSTDLIPIIQYYQDHRELILNAVKVLVFLTMPIDPETKDIPQQIEYLWGLKSAITNSDIVAVIVSLIEGPLENLERESFTEDDWKLVQLVLTFFRNVLAIQDVSFMQKVGESACQYLSLRDRFLEIMFQENVMDLIIVITHHVGGSYDYLRHDNLLVLEIYYHILVNQDPEFIAKACPKDSMVTGNAMASLDSLESIMKAEQEKRKLFKRQSLGRHTQFSGTFTRLTLDGSKAVYKGNPSSASSSVFLRTTKSRKGPNKKTPWNHGRLPSMKDNTLKLLHDFLEQFLSGAYNVLVQSIREDIEKEHPAIQNSDIVVFFQVAEFVTAFQYQKFINSKHPEMHKDASQDVSSEYGDNTLFKGDICGPIAASMNESMFLLVISRWRNVFEGLKETKNYKFLSAAGSLMKIMIRMLDLVLKILPEDSKEPQTARILLYKLFYDQTDQGMTQFLLSLIKSFDSHKQPKSDLADFIEMIHVIVRLMENLEARGTLRVSKKSRKGRKKKKPSDKDKEADLCRDGETVIQNQSVLFNSEQSSDILEKKDQDNVTSFNQDNINDSVHADELQESAPQTENLERNHLRKDSTIPDHVNDNISENSDYSSSDEDRNSTCEVDFKVSTFLSAFANQSIIQNICWLLKFYKSNTSTINHYIICMLRRITDDLDLSPMLYQLSLLIIFYDILAEQTACPCKEYENIVDFLTTVIRRMLRKMKNQPLLFVEILFWKSHKECHYINAEYLLHELGSMRKECSKWENASASGEAGTSKEWAPRSIADALGDDEADVIISYEPGFQNAEPMIEEEVEPVPKRKRRIVFNEELEIKIKELYEEFKDDPNCSRLIAEALQPDGLVSPVQVVNKLKQLGLLVPSKRRKGNANKPSSDLNQLGEEQLQMDASGHNSIGLEGSLPKQSLTKRKRVRAFSKDQEERIRALYEQFKEHKKCNQMIANALGGGDGSLTAAQVSRKLKQLGLRVGRQKENKVDIHFDNEKLNKSSAERQDSDDELLSSLMNRRKDKEIGRYPEESQKQNTEGESSCDSDDDDDEYLRSMLSHASKDVNRQAGKKQKHLEELPSASDNELPRTIIKKSRKLITKGREEMPQAVSSTGKKTDEETYGDGVHEAERSDGGRETTGMKIEGINNDDLDEHALNLDSRVDNEDELLYDDELDDVTDVGSAATSMKSASFRRKKAVIIDDDDDQ